MQTQIKKTTCKSESDQIGFFLLEAISLPLPYRITFTFKLAFPNLDSGHYQGGATTLGKITPPRTDSSHRNWVLLLKNKSSSLFTSIPLRAPPAGSPLLLRCCREEVGGDLQERSSLLHCLLRYLKHLLVVQLLRNVVAWKPHQK